MHFNFEPFELEASVGYSCRSEYNTFPCPLKIIIKRALLIFLEILGHGTVLGCAIAIVTFVLTPVTRLNLKI